jgi:predicted DNA binding protein
VIVLALSKLELQAKLTSKQQKAALLLVESQLSSELDVRDRSLQQIADELGIARMTLYRWNQKRVFIDYKNAITDDMLASYHSQMMKVVVDTAMKHNSLKAVELYAKLRGLLKDHHIVETDTSGSRSEAEVAKELADLEKLLNDTDDDITDEERLEVEEMYELREDDADLLK